MTTDHRFSGAIPETYGRLLVPMLFAWFAGDLARRVTRHDPHAVLETAAGTGIATKELLARLRPDARLVATDLNDAMLDVAVADIADPRVHWRQADAQSLPFDAEDFDAVVCQFGVMFLPDPVRAYTEVRRVLRPGGRFAFNVWDDLAHNDFARIVTAALKASLGASAPDFLARVPYAHADVRPILDQLAAAGFGVVEVETVTASSPARGARDIATAFCLGTPLRHELERLGPTALPESIDCCTREFERRFGAGSIEGRMQAHVFEACRD